MKTKFSLRINENLLEEMREFAQSEGLSTGQLIELACYKLMDQKPTLNKFSGKDKLTNAIQIKTKLNNSTFKKLKKICEEKNITLSQEIRHRLSMTMDNEIFHEQEFVQLAQLRADLNRYGNLLKLAINQNAKIDSDLLEKSIKAIESSKTAFNEILLKMEYRVI